jgi:glycosyltransferase involved in cell wall biosynthesis
MGKPVITSDLPVLRERVASVGGGIAVAKDPHQLADAIGSLLSDPALGSRLGAAGYEHWVRTGSPRRYAQWHIESYARLRSR